MDSSSNLAMMASLDDVAAACAAALIRPPVGYRSGTYNHRAAPFVRLSEAEITGAMPVGVIEVVYREQNGTWRFKSRCPYCGDTHMHGGGTGPVPFFGHRAADCEGGGYALVAVAAEVAA